MPHSEKASAPGKLNSHDAKVEIHAKQHESKVAGKAGAYTHAHDRRSGDGLPIRESPKKGGAGAGNWGSFKDDIRDLKEQGVLS